MAYKRGDFINCEVCGKEFEKKSCNSICCSKECSKENRRKQKKQQRKQQRIIKEEKRLQELQKLKIELGGEWKEISSITGYEEFKGYWISDLGNIIGRNGRILIEEYKHVGGYKMALIKLNGIRKNIDQIIAKAFVEGETEEKCDIDHINQDSTDNRACNLRWVTKGENNKNRDNNKINIKSAETKRRLKKEYQRGDLEGEEWKDIGTLIIDGEQKYISGIYEVSNMGRMRNNEKKTMLAQKPIKSSSGGNRKCKIYYTVTLQRKDGSIIGGQPVHRLVAYAFVEGWSKEKNNINHKNGDSNKAEDLEWVTATENNRHAIENGENNAKGKLSIPIVQLTLEGDFIREWENTCEPGRKGFDHSSIIHCLKGNANSHGGYRWLYKEDYENGNFIPLTETQIKKAKANAKYGGNEGNKKQIANAKYQTEEFLEAVEHYKNKTKSARECVEHAGYESNSGFRKAIKKALELGIIQGSYEDYVW